MKGRLIAATVVTVALISSPVWAGKGGQGKGNGKPAAAVAETVIDTTTPDTPVDTYPPTTTIPFDPGTTITGTLTQTPSNLVWGGEAIFDATYEGRLSNRGTLYVSVVCQQLGTDGDDLNDGKPDVEYQWSQTVATGETPDFGSTHLVFPLVDQAGDGLAVDIASPADCTAVLIYRILNDKDHSYQWLDQTTFTVEAV